MVCGYGPGVMVVGTRPTDGHVFFFYFVALLGVWVGWGGVITFFPLRSSHDVLGFLGC